MVPTWTTKKEKTSKFVDAGSYNMNEREGNQQHGIDRQRTMDKKNKITNLGTERCANIKTLYINNIIINTNFIIIIIIIINNKRKTSKFVDAGNYNTNEGEGYQQLKMGRQRRMEKNSKIKTLGTERCANIETLYINKKKYYY